MVYFELINEEKNNYKFWEIENLGYSYPSKVGVRYGKIGNEGVSKEFIFDDYILAEEYIEKQIESKIKKGYIQKKSNAKSNAKFNVKSKAKSKAKSNVKSNVKFKAKSKAKLQGKTNKCKKSTLKKYQKRNSPPIPANECIIGFISYGNDGNKYIVKEFNSKSGVALRWVLLKIKSTKLKSKVKSKVKSKAKSKVKSKVKTIKSCPSGKVLNPNTNRCINIKSKLTIKNSKNKIMKISNIKLPKGKVLYDVKKQGIMLAHTFKDPKTGKIKSAPKGSTQAPDGWFLSEKYDGYRAIWNGMDFVSRNGNIFPAPPEFKKWLPTNEALDGELFMGRDKFEKCGLFRKKVANPEEWDKANVSYQIFDSPTMSGMFEERTTKIKKLIKEQCNKYKGKCPLIMTKQIKVKNEVDVYKNFDKLVIKGGEGVMLRAPNSPYDKKRSNYLLKVKQLFDAECKIIGYKDGTGKYANMLGAFECELVKNNKIKFTISGMNDNIRNNYKKTHPIGTIVTFTYMGLSSRGVPRHPNYLRKRKKE